MAPRIQSLAQAVLVLIALAAPVYAAPASGQGASTTLVASTTVSQAPATTGTLITSLETEGHKPSPPFPTEHSVTSSVKPSTLSRTVSVKQLNAPAANVDPFTAIATGPPPAQIPQVGNHPQPTGNIVAQGTPLHTNKFYANLFLGSETNGIWTHPYSVSWPNGSGQTSSYGLAIQHVSGFQRGYGPQNGAIPGAPVQYYINPLGIQSIVLSAKELNTATKLSASNMDTFSVNAVLKPSGISSSSITFPLVQGMGFVTGIYQSLQPNIQTGVFFSKVIAAGAVAPGIYKWQMFLNDGASWLMYVTPYQDTGSAPKFSLVSTGLLQGPAGFSGTIQIAKNPTGSAGESVYDKSAGIYPTSGRITGAVWGKTGSYTLAWTVAGKSNGQSLIQYALPHLVQSFDSSTSGNIQHGMQLATTTKGNATAVVGNSWTMIEPSLPVDMGFAPWSPTQGPVATLSSSAVNAIYSAAQIELQQNMSAQTNLNSMYYAGKALSKFATIVYAVHDLCNEPRLAQQGLVALQRSFAVFTQNRQIFPLYYDTVWKGVVSSASYRGGDPGADFGNTFYNDHHFHYAYFLHAAAVVGYLDGAWLAANRDWVNTLARDVSNPSAADPYFPVFRSFDWFHGHSWAKGLFESADGKDQESSSEDAMFSYALKMWGHVAGDASMEARGNLMLAVQARSLPAYFLLAQANANQPASFVPNKVTGILFENKADHTTYFGANLEYVQGIHMLPLVPASALTRPAAFVREEWAAYFAPGAVDDAGRVEGGWKGILYANLALIDPVSSWRFFSSPSFDTSWLDGGASLTWYLAFAAGLGGA